MKLRLPDWRRFSLRSLFVLMTLCCLLFGGWAVYVNPYRIQMQALDTVNRLNARAIPKAPAGFAWQRWLVTKLLGDEAYVQIAEVDLSNRPIDKKDLRAVAGLPFLEKLSLDNTMVNDQALIELRSSSTLTELSLKYANITDRSAEFLSALPRLRRLLLTGTKISDDGVKQFAKLNRLEEVYIRWTHISNAGADRLRKALPRCEVFHQPLVGQIAAAPNQ